MFSIAPVRSWLGLVASLVVALVVQAGLAGSGYAHGEALRLDPAKAKPGDPITVHGTGFEPGASVTIVIEGMAGAVTLDTAEADSEGEFTINASIPVSLSAGSYQVMARMGDESVGADFTVMEGMPMGEEVADVASEAAAGTSVVYQRSAPETIAIGIIVAAVIAAGAYLVLAGTERRPQAQH